MKKVLIALVILVAAAGLGIYFYWSYKHDQEMLHPKFYSGNGRFEATEVYVSPRLGGRIVSVFVKEGDLVKKGDKLVQMQTDTLEAQKASALAKIKTQQGELAMADASVQLKLSAFNGAEKEYIRAKKLYNEKNKGNSPISEKAFVAAETVYNNAKAELEYAKASVLAAQGKIAEQQAELKRIETDIKDSTLYAACDGRIQYLISREGEVVAAGGRVLNLVNLTDSYMTFFLPTRIAGQIHHGSEVRLVFDAAPEYAYNAEVSFIDPVAQFTPKSVETKVEREKLMFRVKAKISADMLQKYIKEVKTGLPGVAWVKVDPKADWKASPAGSLQVVTE